MNIQNSLVALAGCGKMAWTETPAEAFRRKCEEKKAREEDTISGDMMRDE